MFQTSMNSVTQYLNEIGKFPVLSADEMKELFSRYHAGDESAKEILINCNLRLVVQIAKKFLYTKVPFLDLIQEGNIGLIKSIERFDELRDFKFSTYSVPWIKQAIQRYIEEKQGIIRLPVHQHETYRKYINFIDQYCAQYQIYPTKEEVIKALGITESTYDILISFYKFNLPCSLDEPINSDNESVLEEIIADENDQFERMLTENLDLFFLYKIKKLLGNFEYYIVYTRYISKERKTQNELAKEFGITRARLGQIEAIALNKIVLKINRPTEFKTDNEHEISKKITTFNPIPFSMNDVVAFTFFKQVLNKNDISIIFNYIFSDFPISVNDLLKRLGYDNSNENDFKEYIDFLIDMYNSFKNSEEFKIYKNKILSTFKYRKLMETIDTDAKLMSSDASLFENLTDISYEEFVKMHEEELKRLNEKDKKLMATYFYKPNFSQVNNKDLSDAEDEINLVLNDYFNGNTHIDKERLKKFYLANKDKFTNVEQANIEYHLYGLIDVESYTSLINNSQEIKKYIEEYTLLDILEKEYFGVRRLSEIDNKKYDFEYAQSVLYNEDLPLYGNKELFIKIYKMYFGIQEHNRRYSLSEINTILGNIYSQEQIENAVSSVMLAVCKYKKGIKKEKKVITKDEIFEYERNHWQELSSKEIRYIESLKEKNNLSNGSIRAIPKSLKIKIMKQKSDRMVFKISNSSRSKVIEIIRSKRLTKETRNTIMNFYSLNGIDILNGKEKKRVMRIIYMLNKKKITPEMTLKKKK